MKTPKHILEFGEYTLVCHTTGRLRFAVWQGDEEICWCVELDHAAKIITALRRPA